MEYKVLRFRGLLFVTNPRRKAIHSSPFHKRADKSDILEFAEQAVQALARKCPGLVTDGLLRVDIMSTAKGKVIVNEFESLEAMYVSSNSHETHLVEMKLIEFWRDVLRKLLSSFLLV